MYCGEESWSMVKLQGIARRAAKRAIMEEVEACDITIDAGVLGDFRGHVWNICRIYPELFWNAVRQLWGVFWRSAIPLVNFSKQCNNLLKHTKTRWASCIEA